MLLTQKVALRSAELERTIKQQIVERTNGRIRMLQVELIDNRVIICGSVPSYHVKQLALQGVREAIAFAAGIQIELNLEVSGNEPGLLSV